jgi:hypothetical protein
MRNLVALVILGTCGVFAWSVVRQVKSRGATQLRRVILGEIFDACLDVIFIFAQSADKFAVAVQKFIAMSNKALREGARKKSFPSLRLDLATQAWAIELSCSRDDAKEWRSMCRLITDSNEKVGIERARRLLRVLPRPSQARNWLSRGFSAEQTTASIANGFTDPDEALPWKGLIAIGISSSQIRRWQSRVEHLTPERLQDWVNAGFGNDLDDALEYHEAGYVPLTAHGWRSKFTSFSSAKPWFGRGLKPTEAANWARAGFSDQVSIAKEFIERRIDVFAAAEWRRIGCTPAEAEIWRDAGLGPADSQEWQGWIHDIAEIGPWRKSGFDGVQARKWKEAGFQVNEAASWRDIGTLDRVIEWRDHGFTAESARDWSATKLLPRDAAGFRDSQVSVENAVRWRDSFGGYGPAKDWIQQRFSVSEASDWALHGFDAKISIASEFRRFGFSPSAAEEWARHDFDAKSAHEYAIHQIAPSVAAVWRAWPYGVASIAEWSATGLTPLRAQAWRAAGFSSQDTLAWQKVGDPEAVQDWRTLGFTPETASQWASHGFSGDEAKALCRHDLQPSAVLREAVRRTSVEQTVKWLGIGVAVERIILESERWSVDAYRQWTRDGEREADAVFEWYVAGVDQNSIEEWLDVGAPPTVAKLLEERGLAFTDYPRVSEISGIEAVGTLEAIWRYAIERRGYERQDSAPIFYQQSGAGTAEEVAGFLQFVSENRAEQAWVWHDAPRLGKAMLEALPEARLIRGKTKRVIWYELHDELGEFEVREVDSYFLLKLRTGRLSHESTDAAPGREIRTDE